MSAFFDGSASLFLQTNIGATPQFTASVAHSNIWSFWFRANTQPASVATTLVGNNSMISLGPVSQQLRFRRYHVTAWGIYDSTDANISTNVWYHVTLIMTSVFNTATTDFQIWLGTETTLPRKLSFTTAQLPSGNVASETDLYLGGLGVGGNPLTGYISQAFNITTPVIGGLTVNDYVINDEYAFTRHVLPIYMGTYDTEMMMGPQDGKARQTVLRVRWMPLDGSFTDASASQVRFPYYAWTTDTDPLRNFEGLTNQLPQAGTTSATYSSLEPSRARFTNIPIVQRSLPLLLSRV